MALPEFHPILYQPFPTIAVDTLVGSRYSLRASQPRAIEALARQSDVKAAARDCGVEAMTLRRWLRDPNFKKKLAVRRRQAQRGSEWANLRRKAEQLGVRIVHQTQGREFDYGGARFEVLAPVADYQPSSMARNNDSLVMRLTYRERSLMLSGDVERQIESELVAANLVHRADILKVAHHGSKTSTTEPFLEAVHPAFAVISAGFANLYGHPNAEVVDRLHAANIEVLRTDQMGAVTVRTDGHRFEVETRAPGF